MFENTVFLLLEGEFICAVSHPDEYRYLGDEVNREEVSRYLARLRRRLTQTPHQSGFYLSFAEVGERERKTIASSFQDIKDNLVSVVRFFQLVIRTTGQEDLMMPGAILETANIMAKIDQDPGLRMELENVAMSSRVTVSESAHRSMFDRLVGKLKTDGYVVLANKERGLFQVTAKMEYLIDVVRFLQENDPVLARTAEAEEVPVTEQLL